MSWMIDCHSWFTIPRYFHTNFSVNVFLRNPETTLWVPIFKVAVSVYSFQEQSYNNDTIITIWVMNERKKLSKDAAWFFGIGFKTNTWKLSGKVISY